MNVTCDNLHHKICVGKGLRFFGLQGNWPPFHLFRSPATFRGRAMPTSSVRCPTVVQFSVYLNTGGSPSQLEKKSFLLSLLDPKIFLSDIGPHNPGPPGSSLSFPVRGRQETPSERQRESIQSTWVCAGPFYSFFFHYILDICLSDIHSSFPDFSLLVDVPLVTRNQLLCVNSS